VTLEPNTPRPEPSGKTERPRRTWRGAAVAAAYGAIAASLGYVIGRGDLFWALVVMIVIGVLFRLYVHNRINRRGDEHPRWWKWL
jgi:hypothetical protein